MLLIRHVGFTSPRLCTHQTNVWTLRRSGSGESVKPRGVTSWVGWRVRGSAMLYLPDLNFEGTLKDPLHLMVRYVLLAILPLPLSPNNV